MPILNIKHVTTYHYRQPVAFGEHRMMLRPRDDGDQRVLESRLDITPKPSRLSWTRDKFGNHVAIAHFADRSAELRFESTVQLDHTPVAGTLDDGSDAALFLTPISSDSRVRDWSASFAGKYGADETVELLSEMARTMKRTFRHVARHEKGILDPARTLEFKNGSCRDLAILMIAALRSLGVPARFVSGYLNIANDDDDGLSGGNTHAWVQAYVPGIGWLDADPSRGAVGNDNLVRVAVVDEPNEAIPLQGTWIGSAADHLAMKVGVKVTTGGSAS